MFKPEIDERFSRDHIVSHSEMKHESANVRTAADVRANVEPDTEVVGIDEAQFFDIELVQVVNELAELGMRVIVAGLDQDYTGKPWEPMPQLLAVAEYITKTQKPLVILERAIALIGLQEKPGALPTASVS